MSFKYRKGDYIRYGSNGVCLIDDIKSMRNHSKGTNSDFYILKPIGSASSTIYVPVDNEDITSKMRYILSKDEIDSLIIATKTSEDLWVENRKERTAIFRSIISRGDQKELLRLISCIYLKRNQLEAEKKKLSATDESILKQAEGIIDNEFAFVLNLKGNQVGDYIRSKLSID